MKVAAAKFDLAMVCMIGLIIAAPILLYGIPHGNDLPHHFRLAIGFYDSITSGDLYPSWLEHTNAGYGDPSPRFYPPGLYYILPLARLIGLDWYFATALGFALITVAGGIGMYLWARSISGSSFAVAAAAIYLLSPFHANEMYQAGMYPQYLCASITPFAFYFAERIVESGRWRDASGLAASLALMILSNLPFALIGCVSLSIYCSVRMIQVRSLRSFLQLCAGAVCGLMISCGFWLTALSEMSWKKPSGAGQSGWFDYRNNFILNLTVDETGSYWTTILAGVMLLLFLPSAVLIFRRSTATLALAITGAFSLFMATVLSRPIWDAVPLIDDIQFPWRWLTVACAVAAALAAVSLREIAALWKTRLRPLALLLPGVIVIACFFTVRQVIGEATFIPRAEFNDRVRSLVGSDTNPDFLPIWASPPLPIMAEPELMKTRSLTLGGGNVFDVAAGPPEDARSRKLYYPLWKATISGESLPTKPAPDGALLVEVPDRGGEVDVEFVEPARTTFASCVSAAGVLLATAGMFIPRKRIYEDQE